MSSFSAISQKTKIITGLLILSLLVLCAGSIFFAQKILVQNAVPTPITTHLAPFSDSTDLPARPVSVIQPLIQDCLFVYFQGCVQRIAQNLVNENNKYENFAAKDIQYIFSFNQQSTLFSYSEVVDPSFTSRYFPESATTSSSTKLEQRFTAEQILQRVSIKENINPRVLLTLMEVTQNGKGVISTSRNAQQPFFDNDLGFAKQLTTVSQELSASALKYQLQKQDGKALPKQLVFFNKAYTVGDQTTGDTLALVEFLAAHSKGKGQFEQSIEVEQTESAPANNFVGLYTQLFSVDPIQNIITR